MAMRVLAIWRARPSALAASISLHFGSDNPNPTLLPDTASNYREFALKSYPDFKGGMFPLHAKNT
jgi:hypothetical protein